MTKPNEKSLSINKGDGQNDSVNPNYRSRKSSLLSKSDYVDGIKRGDRTILSRAITLVESSKNDQRQLGQEILEELIHLTGNSIRIGITGVPGVGKSTFIEALGKHLLEKKKKIAVLTVDPTSTRSKGSILGDKTRMATLSASDDVYIRPSPTSGNLGGVARTSRETMMLCEAAGFDTILIETVGVGQSETSVHNMVDFFLLLMLAGAGDELQGIKRGIMEMADMIAVNKAEEENIDAANRAKQEYRNALSLFPPTPSKWEPKVLTCSALDGTGIPEVWEQIEEYFSVTKDSGYFHNRREKQSTYWMYEAITRELKNQFFGKKEIREALPDFEDRVRKGKISSFRAAEMLMEKFNS